MSADDQPPPRSALHVIVTDAQGRTLRRPALTGWLRRVAPAGATGEVSVALVSDAAIRRLNREYAGHDYATDVLSFPATDDVRTSGRPDVRTSYLGDIVIAQGVAARQARQAGHPVGTELKVLALHGLLHLLGYDHATDDGKMARLERQLRRKGGLKEGLIDRSRLPRRSDGRKKSSRTGAKAGRSA